MLFEESPLLKPPLDQSSLKILIAAMPKAGNTWMENMLSFAYDLPVRELPRKIATEDLEALGDRWVSHQHLFPNAHSLRILREHGVIVITMVRHPADVLVSLKNYLVNFPDEQKRRRHAGMLLRDGAEFGSESIAYVRRHFAIQISISLIWMKLGAPVVRYEDLRAETVESLKRITDCILPLDRTRLEASVVLTSLARMRQRHVDTSLHFRKGATGEWKDVLPDEIVEIFRTVDPYPAQFRALEYTLDENATRSAQSREVDNLDPFQGETAFDNGVPLTDYLIQLYFLRIPGAKDRWPRPTETKGDDSFFSWLCGRCSDDTESESSGLHVTNLAYEIWKRRADLRNAFPNPFGGDRLDFVHWFLIHAYREFEIDSALFASVLAAVAKTEQLRVPPLYAAETSIEN